MSSQPLEKPVEETTQDDALNRVAEKYAVAVTPHVLSLVDTDDPADPIARQYLPDAAELHATEAELADPIGDQTHSPVRGVVHRYPDRVLLMPVEVCAVYCRFCFRRETVGKGTGLREAELEAALDYIRENTGIHEVILSGGDPLVLSARRLRRIIHALDAIDHVRVIRIHTRVPVADPARVTPDLIGALEVDTAVYVSIHCNHPRELTPGVRHVLRRISRAGIPMVAQTVLLRGVNDDGDVLESLFRELTANRVKPYYLHHPDLARGTSHFRLPLATGRGIMEKLRGRLSGLSQPQYVLDIPGGHGKVPVGPDYVVCDDDGNVFVRDPCGALHAYPDDDAA